MAVTIASGNNVGLLLQKHQTHIGSSAPPAGTCHKPYPPEREHFSVATFVLIALDLTCNYKAMGLGKYLPDPG